MGERDPRAALDAAHHLLWLAASDAQGGCEPHPRKRGRSLVDRCSRLAAACGQAAEPFDEDDKRARGYLRAAYDLVCLADADAPSAKTSRAIDALVAALGAAGVRPDELVDP